MSNVTGAQLAKAQLKEVGVNVVNRYAMIGRSVVKGSEAHERLEKSARSTANIDSNLANSMAQLATCRRAMAEVLARVDHIATSHQHIVPICERISETKLVRFQ
jgi:BLOC-1-related complex sub-unit 7